MDQSFGGAGRLTFVAIRNILVQHWEKYVKRKLSKNEQSLAQAQTKVRKLEEEWEFLSNRSRELPRALREPYIDMYRLIHAHVPSLIEIRRTEVEEIEAERVKIILERSHVDDLKKYINDDLETGDFDQHDGEEIEKITKDLIEIHLDERINTVIEYGEQYVHRVLTNLGQIQSMDWVNLHRVKELCRISAAKY